MLRRLHLILGIKHDQVLGCMAMGESSLGRNIMCKVTDWTKTRHMSRYKRCGLGSGCEELWSQLKLHIITPSTTNWPKYWYLNPLFLSLSPAIIYAVNKVMTPFCCFLNKSFAVHSKYSILKITHYILTTRLLSMMKYYCKN